MKALVQYNLPHMDYVLIWALLAPAAPWCCGRWATDVYKQPAAILIAASLYAAPVWVFGRSLLQCFAVTSVWDGDQFVQQGCQNMVWDYGSQERAARVWPRCGVRITTLSHHRERRLQTIDSPLWGEKALDYRLHLIVGREGFGMLTPPCPGCCVQSTGSISWSG